ncbi:hypothetical protein BGZ95_008931 [Linnemannia exigua]|uniref:Uncharacterized protein n=1 Tax=Linnemannia exigua TaxID=604196 RepID=A0AAD4DDM1_9FUNG|nr:hypothetical protein BGZ95_008931 [Linnemannia exigua]
MSTHPLEVPEILTRIGQYLPLWVEHQDEVDLDNKDITFRHHALWSCMQVSKLWHQTFLPILWYSYDGLKMVDLPQEVVTRYSPYFRNFRSPGCHAGPFLSTHLVELTIYIQMMDPPITLSTQKDLIRANPRLKYLEWHGPERLTDLDKDDFEGLKCLQELRLFHWNGGGRRLAKVLGAVAGSLCTFEVSRIKNVMPGDLSGSLQRQLDKVQDESIDEYRENDDTSTVTVAGVRGVAGEDGLVLPHMEKLKVIFDRNPDYVELAQCCPNLRRLTVAGLGHGDTGRLSMCLRNQCQQLKSLVLKDVLLPQEDAIELLLSCLAAGGLVKIHLDVVGLEQDLITAILLHATTLEHLTIASSAEDSVDLDGILRIMVECEQLKHLRFMLDTSVPDEDVLDAWRSQEWGCSGLERLGLEFNYCEFGDLDDEEDDDEGDEDEEIIDEDARYEYRSTRNRNADEAGNDESEDGADLQNSIEPGSAKMSRESSSGGSSGIMAISSEVSYMGWYRHPQESHDFESRRDQTDKPALRMLFEMVQDMKRLHTLVWKDIMYSRSRSPPRRR